jgi:Spy/CpxP family protein refolding chaperone
MFLASLVLAAAAMPALAQSDLIELMRSDLRTEKMAIVTKAMQLTEAQSQAFWPVYKEYESAMMKINDERVSLIKDYAASYDSMTDEGAKDLIKRAFKLQEARTKTLKSYVGKMSKAVDAKTAARWAQVEQALGSAIDLQVASELPLLK